MRSRRLIPILAAVSALASAAPAHGANTLEQSASAHNLGALGQGSATTNMLARCTARASETAVRTTINECYLLGQFTGERFNAQPTALPDGPLAISSGLFRDIAAQPYKTCVRSTATFSNGQTISLPLECFVN
jgi:hypothetical protein